MSRKRKPGYLVSFSKQEMSFILDALHVYNRHEEVDRKLLGDVREKLALAHYGKIKKTEIPDIRDGRRVPRWRPTSEGVVSTDGRPVKWSYQPDEKDTQTWRAVRHKGKKKA